jgi:hypothetical protein
MWHVSMWQLGRGFCPTAPWVFECVYVLRMQSCLGLLFSTLVSECAAGCSSIHSICFKRLALCCEQ